MRVEIRPRSRSLPTIGCSRVEESARIPTATPSWSKAPIRATRVDEWREFEGEIASEIAKPKCAFSELEEEEQGLDRLRRWYRDLKKRDVLGLPEAERAAAHLAECGRVLDEYAERVYAVIRSAAGG